MPCDIGANHCRLLHTGWEKCGHGPHFQAKRIASEGFLNELLLLFRYLPASAAALSEGYSGRQVGFPLGAFLLMVAPLTW